jgi:hypothetical protein
MTAYVAGEVVFAIATGLFAFLGWKTTRRARLGATDRKLPLLSIADVSAKIGERVRVRGIARARIEPASAPITKKPCLYARIEIYSAAQRLLQPLGADARGVDALLDDATGTIVVPLAGAVVAVEQAIESWEATAAEEARIEEWLRGVRKSRRPFRFREDVVQSGDELEVTGRLAVEHDASGEGGSYRDAPHRLTFSSQHPVFVRVVARPEQN